MNRPLVSVALAIAALAPLAACNGNGSTDAKTTCATTADCPPENVCRTPQSTCEPVPENEFVGTFKCYLINQGDQLPSGTFGESEVEGIYDGTQLNLVLSAGCDVATLSDGTQVLIVDIDAFPNAPDGVIGMSFALSFQEAQQAPIDIDLNPDANVLNSGILAGISDAGQAANLATVAGTGVVHLDVPAVVGSWLTGYVDAPLLSSQ